MSAVLWWSVPPAVWCAAMVVREWVHTKQHGRRVERHRLMLEAHDTAIENALLLGERSQLETRLNGLMTDALRTAFGADYPTGTPAYDRTAELAAELVARADELLSLDDFGPDDLGWTES